MNREFEKLTAAYLAGEEVADELLEACRAHPEWAKELANEVAIDRLLPILAKDDAVFTAGVLKQLEPELETFAPKKSATRHRWVRFVQVAAAASLAILGLFIFSGSGKGVATLVSSTDASWELQALEPGDVLKRGIYSLVEGYSEVSLNSGVRLILEAPIEMEIKSADLVHVHQGRLVARVPKAAIGFTVLTPSSEVVDLGTEFGISVSQSGASEVHVLEGEVKARPLENKNYSNLLKDEGMTFDENQHMTLIQSNPETFRRALPGRSANQPQYLHWSFDASRSKVVCSGTGIEGKLYHGELKAQDNGDGPVYEAGQFGESLYFNGSDAYVKTEFPGIGGNSPRTVAFWAKIPSEFSVRNGYAMISWGLMERGRAWQISPNPDAHEGPLGRLRIGAMNAPVIGTTDLRDDRWHHVAVVMYGGDEANLSTHVLLYIDGKLEKTSVKSIARIETQLNHQESRLLMMGRNMGFADEGQNIKNRFFKGWLDEVYLFDTALEAQSIRALMNSNKLISE